MTDLSSQDLQELKDRGIDPAEIERQLALYRRPPPAIDLVRPCTPGDGVHRLPEELHPALLERHAAAAAEGRFTRFVPASGAASRMFRDLSAARSLPPAGQSADPAVRRLAERIDDFAFGAELRDALARRGASPDDAPALLRTLLDAGGLGYASLPKGLLQFHRYPDGPRTAFEEHLVEAARTVRDSEGAARIHVTISPEHLDAFQAALERGRPRFGDALDTRFEVVFSTQDPATDTVAVDSANRPFRREDGSLLFRPGGHGALLGNIAHLKGDLIAIKNIDNIVPDSLREPTLLWKKLLGGLVVDLADTVHAVLRDLEADPLDPAAAARGKEWVARWLGSEAADGVEASPGALRARLDRPIRVCGMVQNEGEPGGGPFWVRSAEQEISPQIVESSQVDPHSAGQQSRWTASTHFNPVDLTLAVRDPWNRPYDLDRFVDPRTVFVATKSHQGQILKSLERPGLWNGAMALWNTVFVEVPGETFAPVKTVFDLLRPQHQPAG